MAIGQRSLCGLIWLGAILLVLGDCTFVSAQYQPNLPSLSGQVPPTSDDKPLDVTESNAGILDPAVPLTMMRIRGNLLYNNPQPSRAEYLLAKPASLGGRGMATPETRVDSQDVDMYGEVAWYSFFSTFVEIPYVFMNPRDNANSRGYGDSNFGFKLCTWSSDSLIATFQTRFYNPLGSSSTGNQHWTFEPALLGSYKFLDQFLLEGQFKYWMPLNGSDYSGDMFIYGLGLSYGQRQTDGFWYAPVVEGIGWTIMSGQSVIATSPVDYMVQDTRNQTIINGYLGIRLGYGSHIDGYLGYGRCFTGDCMSRDNVRLEFRLLY